MALSFDNIMLIAVVSCTAVAYIILFTVGRKWRKNFEEKGIKFWKAPKEERLEELLLETWKPKVVATVHGLSYFTEGYVRTSMVLWVSLFLIQVKGVSTWEAAIFQGLIFVVWSWKAFIGMISDAFPLTWRGKQYRRLQYFLLSGLLSAMASLTFLFLEPEAMPVWTVFFPAVTAILSADGILDLAADSYSCDVTPPNYHGRILGSVGFGARSLGAVMASIIGPLLISIGGYRLIFLSSGLIGLLALVCVPILKEPKLEFERRFTKEAVAFTFTEKTVFLLCIFGIGIALAPRAFSVPMGGMFTLVASKVVQVSPEFIGNISLLCNLSGAVGYIIAGYISDRFGHRRVTAVGMVIFIAVGLLWATIGYGMVMWFSVLAVLINFISPFRGGSAVIADVTPLALASTVFQMQASFVWIGGYIASFIMGLLLPISFKLAIVIFSLLQLIQLTALYFIKLYDTAKATTL